MDKAKSTKVLFVCMANVCRSPAGEGMLKHLIQEHPSLTLHVESCGIGDWHLGQSPDWRMQEAAKSRGIPLTSVAKQFKSHFLDEYDYILVSDQEVLKHLYHYAKSPEQKSKVYLMTAFSPIYKGQEVPDPYYLGEGSFELILDILEDSCAGLLDHIQNQK